MKTTTNKKTNDANFDDDHTLLLNFQCQSHTILLISSSRSCISFIIGYVMVMIVIMILMSLRKMEVKENMIIIKATRGPRLSADAAKNLDNCSSFERSFDE
jgi:hypothetical protein